MNGKTALDLLGRGDDSVVMFPLLQALNVRGLQRDDGAAFLNGIVVGGDFLPVNQQILEFGIRRIGTDRVSIAVIGGVGDGVCAGSSGSSPD